MSVTDLPSVPNAPAKSGPRAPGETAAGLGLWTRVAVVCALLIGSGVVRLKQSERIKGQLSQGLDSFALDSLPMTLGPWKGETTTIDPLIARATGAKQIVTRRYVNQETGVAVDAILLFGSAVDMYIHTPELCYPAAGFAQTGGPDARMIPMGPNGGEAPFRALVYSKGEGSSTAIEEVYYSWRYNDKWSPQVGSRKHFERISGMYKVHIARRMTERERRDVGNPTEDFLTLFLPEMERRITAFQSSSS